MPSVDTATTIPMARGRVASSNDWETIAMLVGKRMRGADALHHPGGHDRGLVDRQPARERGDAEQGHTDQQGPPAAQHVADAPAGHQQGGERQQVAGHGPLQVGGRHLQVARHLGQRHREREVVQRDEHLRETHREQDQRPSTRQRSPHSGQTRGAVHGRSPGARRGDLGHPPARPRASPAGRLPGAPARRRPDRPRRRLVGRGHAGGGAGDRSAGGRPRQRGGAGGARGPAGDGRGRGGRPRAGRRARRGARGRPPRAAAAALSRGAGRWCSATPTSRSTTWPRTASSSSTPGSPTDRRRAPRHSMAEILLEDGRAPAVRFWAVDDPAGPLAAELVRGGRGPGD